MTNCGVHTGNIRIPVLNHGPNKVGSVRKTKVRIFARMDRINWLIRALLYSHNQRSKPSLNSEPNKFVSSLKAAIGREIFSSSSISFKVKLSFKKLKLAKKFLSSILFVYRGSSSISLSNTALNGPFNNRSNRAFLSGYKITGSNVARTEALAYIRPTLWAMWCGSVRSSLQTSLKNPAEAVTVSSQVNLEWQTVLLNLYQCDSFWFNRPFSQH